MISMTRILKSKCVIIIICIPFSQERVCKYENAPLVKKERVIAVKKDPDQSPPTLPVKPEPVTLGTPVKMDHVVTKMERIPTPQRRRAGVDNAQGWVS